MSGSVHCPKSSNFDALSPLRIDREALIISAHTLKNPPRGFETRSALIAGLCLG